MCLANWRVLEHSAHKDIRRTCLTRDSTQADAKKQNWPLQIGARVYASLRRRVARPRVGTAHKNVRLPTAGQISAMLVRFPP